MPLAGRAPARQRLVEVDQHDHAGLCGDAGQGDEAHRDRDAHVEPHEPDQPQAAGQREGHRQHDDHGLGDAAEVEMEQDEDQQQGRRHDEHQPGLGSFEILELAAPYRVGARR